jgi:hypothetical protein
VDSISLGGGAAIWCVHRERPSRRLRQDRSTAVGVLVDHVGVRPIAVARVDRFAQNLASVQLVARHG